MEMVHMKHLSQWDRTIIIWYLFVVSHNDEMDILLSNNIKMLLIDFYFPMIYYLMMVIEIGYLIYEYQKGELDAENSMYVPKIDEKKSIFHA